MKKFVLTFWILIMVLFPVNINAAENQSIIFGGSYSADNKVTDADSAWLYLFYYATKVGSTTVTAEDLQWGGCYQYEHKCTNDSADGWTGWWVYFDDSEAVQLGEWATVATARDSSYSTLTTLDNIGVNAEDVDGSFNANDFDLSYYGAVSLFLWTYGSGRTITGADDAFYEIIGDTIRPIFNDSIPGLMDTLLLKARHAQVDSLKDTTEDMSTRLLADTTGISESVADQVWREDLTGHNIYGGAAVNMLALAGIQALSLAPASHEQTTTRIALNLTATTDDVFNGCMLAARSGVNKGHTVIITDYEAYSGDSGVVIVSPPLVLAATENQLFVITGADHAEGDTINRAASVLVASDNIGINAGDVDGQFTAADFDVPYYISVGYYNWQTATRTITGADDAFYEIIGDTIRPIFGDSIPALMDTIYLMLDSLYAIMDSLRLQAWWSTSDCEGVGAYTCTLYVTDTLNDMRIPDVNVSINNQAEDAVPRVVQTNSNGFIIVQYSDGDYRATVNNPLYRNNEGGSPFLDFTVDGAPLLDSIMGYLQSVGTPSSAEVCSVYGWMYNVESAPVAGATIIFDLISDQDTLYYDNVTYVPGRTIAKSNSDGYWSIGVVPNELLDTLSFYGVDIIRDHTRKPILEHYDVYVPDSATVKLNDLLISFNRKGK